MMQKNDLNKRKKRLCIVASGSGGHITPALCLGDKWHNQHALSGHMCDILFFSSTKKLDKAILDVHETSLTIKSCSLINLPGKRLWLYPIFFAQFVFVFFKSLLTLARTRPEKIVSTGGLLAVPVCLAGRCLRIPIELHELNVIPGKAIRFLSPFAHKTFVTFVQSKNILKDAHLTPYPIRFKPGDEVYEKNELITRINEDYAPPIPLAPTYKTIFLLGGSQGSLFLNDTLKQVLEEQRSQLKNIQIIHQVGHADTRNWKSFYSSLNIPAITFSYTHNIKDLYRAANLLISRAGAGTLFELEFFKKKSILVPLASLAGGHQIANARAMAEKHPHLFTVCKKSELHHMITTQLALSQPHIQSSSQQSDEITEG